MQETTAKRVPFGGVSTLATEVSELRERLAQVETRRDATAAPVPQIVVTAEPAGEPADLVTSIVLARAKRQEELSKQREREDEALRARAETERTAHLVADEVERFSAKVVEKRLSWGRLVTEVVRFVEQLAPKLLEIGFSMVKGQFKLETAIDLLLSLGGQVAKSLPVEEIIDEVEERVELLFNSKRAGPAVLDGAESVFTVGDSLETGETGADGSAPGTKKKKRRGFFGKC